MTAARLSPSANLLRNSKLFALPPSLSLPFARPSAEPTADSDTATTTYPIKAALETPTSSLKVGDWGLKRAIPRKTTTSTTTPTIRLSRDIDTEGHIADFESAADHVVTLKKWQNVSPQFVNAPRGQTYTSGNNRRVYSVFHPDLDNTTHLATKNELPDYAANRTPEHLQKSLEQFRQDQRTAASASDLEGFEQRPRPSVTIANKKRWRYRGPWLAGMSNLEFDTFLKKVTSPQGLIEFSDFLVVKEHLDNLNRKVQEASAAAAAAQAQWREAERLSQEEVTEVEQTDEPLEAAARNAETVHLDAIDKLNVAQRNAESGQLLLEINATFESPEALAKHRKHLQKKLRAEPQHFAKLIADFLDLPDGPSRPPMRMVDSEIEWKYKRANPASPNYQETGPPRTHPSAGFSYTRSNQFARNDPSIGPAYPNDILPARMLKDTLPPPDAPGGRHLQQSIGVAGLIGRLDNILSRAIVAGDQWRPMPGGPKTVVKLLDASVQQDGGIEVGVLRDKQYDLDEDEMPYNKQDWEKEVRARRTMPQTTGRLPPLDQHLPPRRSYRKAEPLTGLKANAEADGSDIMAALKANLSRSEL